MSDTIRIVYFKKVYNNRPECPCGYGKWREGDGINYNPTKYYTVEEITEQEYINGCVEVEAYFEQKYKQKRIIELKEKIYVREQISEDKTEFQSELDKLEAK